jgi:hypothetical protein
MSFVGISTGEVVNHHQLFYVRYRYGAVRYRTVPYCACIVVNHSGTVGTVRIRTVRCGTVLYRTRIVNQVLRNIILTGILRSNSEIR